MGVVGSLEGGGSGVVVRGLDLACGLGVPPRNFLRGLQKMLLKAFGNEYLEVALNLDKYTDSPHPPSPPRRARPASIDLARSPDPPPAPAVAAPSAQTYQIFVILSYIGPFQY